MFASRMRDLRVKKVRVRCDKQVSMGLSVRFEYGQTES